MSQFLQHVDKMAGKFNAAIPAEFAESLGAQRVIGGLRMAFADNKSLARCDPASVRTAVIHALSLGLDPSGLTGDAHLVPRGNQCTLLISFKGKLALARRSGAVHDIQVGVIYENDDYSIDLMAGKYSHNVRFGVDRGKPIAAYAMAMVNGSERPMFAHITYDEWFRNLAKGSRSPAYKSWAMEMFKKTALNRLIKMLPASVYTAQTNSVERQHEYAATNDGAHVWADRNGRPIILEEGEVVEDAPAIEQRDEPSAEKPREAVRNDTDALLSP